MTSGQGSTTTMTTVEEVARACLDALTDWVGIAGLAAATRDPDLRAAINQHTAAVRGELGDTATQARALAEHARQVHAAATAAGHRMPDPYRLDWVHAPAYLLRLVAVCALAGAADHL